MTTTTAEDKAKAEDLRLQGNDAFQQEDFEQALKLYTESAQLCPKANTLSNKAAALQKLGRHEEACQAAESATQVDPKWAKGWWRRGVAAELIKNFHAANKYYAKAVQLDKKNPTFRQHHNDIKKRLNLVEQHKKTENDMPFVQQMENNKPKITAMDLPTMKAFKRAEVLVAHMVPFGTLYDLQDRYCYANSVLQNLTPTSEQYLFHGIAKWITGMKCAIADLASSFKPGTLQFARNMSLKFKHNTISVEEIELSEEMLGGLVTGDATHELISGYAHLGGQNVFIETAPGRVCPEPDMLRRYVGYQILAQLGCVQKWVQKFLQDFGFGPDVPLAPGVLEGYVTFYHNFNTPQPIDVSHKSTNCTPQDIADYIRKEVSAGRTWDDGGLRVYVKAMYLGSILFATVAVNVGQQVAHAYQQIKWARELITLLDEEYKVSENEDFDTHGTSFKPSLRVGLLMAELHMVNTLRAGSVNGPYPLSLSLDLCLEIIKLANNLDTLITNDYGSVQFDVSYRRKPLAVAHAFIAAQLNKLSQIADTREDFMDTVIRHGFIQPNEADDCDIFTLIAEHYRIAAENELPDAEDGSILWWAHAGNLAQSSIASERTLGDLRNAIGHARACDSARDVDLFGPNLQKGGEYESIAVLTAKHFEDQPDSFVFPRVVMNWEEGTMELCGGDVICDDFEKYKQNELKQAQHAQWNEKLLKLMDTTELEEKYGLVAQQ